MKVLKFGGTSVGSPERMKQVAEIISNIKGRKLVVLSAVSGNTNKLVSISEKCELGDKTSALGLLKELREVFNPFLDQLYEKKELREDTEKYINQVMDDIEGLIDQPYSTQVNKMMVVQGELISTRMFTNYLKDRGEDVTLLMAQNFMTLDENDEPDMVMIEKKLEHLLSKTTSKVLITQGFLTRNAAGGIDNLKRGGSDYSATIIGSVLKSDEIQIWTDIDGMHNNDPRVVEKTFPLAKLSFEEASELAYFGAKVLHPTCIVPAQQFGVPVRIKNTMAPEANGTLISDVSEGGGIKAIAAKDNITAIKIKSSRMVMAYGFMRRVFEIFEMYKTPIDMITTSEIAVSLTIDNNEHLPEIEREISKYGKVEIDKDQTIVCIVGDDIAEKRGLGKQIFKVLDDVPIRMISFGGSRNNISILIDSSHKKTTLQRLNGLFEK
ncbi:MAG: aspartate kinase [Cyclobacteriaceae bacterium]